MHSTSFELEKPHNYPNNTHRKACIFCRTATANQGYFQEVNIPFKDYKSTGGRAEKPKHQERRGRQRLYQRISYQFSSEEGILERK